MGPYHRLTVRLSLQYEVPDNCEATYVIYTSPSIRCTNSDPSGPFDLPNEIKLCPTTIFFNLQYMKSGSNEALRFAEMISQLLGSLYCLTKRTVGR